MEQTVNYFDNIGMIRRDFLCFRFQLFKILKLSLNSREIFKDFFKKISSSLEVALKFKLYQNSLKIIEISLKFS